MAIVSMKALLESGVHFGHRTHKWNPAMKPYIFTERNSIHIIDLQKTVKALDEAYNLVRDTVSEEGTVLFVGTKRQAQETIYLEATRCGMPYVTMRWLGGMLTNWRTIRQRLNELEGLERMRDGGDFERLPKKEVLLLTRRMDRLEMLLGGIRHMAGVPDLLFVVDVRREETSIHEANLLDIPVVAMVDTNCDPRNIDYVIPSNDDAIRAIKLLVGKIAEAVLEGKAMRKEEEVEPAPEIMEMVGADEPELSDEELLGEATLAKLAFSTAASTEEEEGAEQVEEEGVEEQAEAVEVVEQVEVEEVEEIEEVVEQVEEMEVEEVEEVVEQVEVVEAEEVEEIAEETEATVDAEDEQPSEDEPAAEDGDQEENEE
ncbi:MAG: 30S ribosomal protein S2 [Anaerolineales bacterium]|nr:30S ribosomal protein S2 [Anaerolineales bacterium]